MVELFVGGLAGIDVGVPEFEAIKHPGEFGRWGAGEQKSSISKQSDVDMVFSNTQLPISRSFLEGSSEGRFGIFGLTAEIRPIMLHSNLLIVSSRDAAQPLKVLTAALALSARNSHRRHR
jgi:hypothetical protein